MSISGADTYLSRGGPRLSVRLGSLPLARPSDSLLPYRTVVSECVMPGVATLVWPRIRNPYPPIRPSGDPRITVFLPPDRFCPSAPTSHLPGQPISRAAVLLSRVGQPNTAVIWISLGDSGQS